MKRFLFISLSVFFIMLLPVMVKADSTDEDSSKSYGEQLEQEADQKADDAVQGANDNVNNTLEQLKHGASNINPSYGNTVMVAVLRGCYRFYIGIKAMGGYLTALSWLTGVLMFVLCRKNKKMKRLGIYGFGFMFPVLLWIFIIGIGTLNGIWLHSQNQTLQYGQLYLNIAGKYTIYKASQGQSAYAGIMNGLNDVLGGISTMTPILITIFEAQGIIRFALCKYDSNKKDLGLYGYCIAVPIALIVASVGVRFLGGIFK